MNLGSGQVNTHITYEHIISTSPSFICFYPNKPVLNFPLVCELLIPQFCEKLFLETFSGAAIKQTADLKLHRVRRF